MRMLGWGGLDTHQATWHHISIVASFRLKPDFSCLPSREPLPVHRTITTGLQLQYNGYEMMYRLAKSFLPRHEALDRAEWKYRIH